MTSETRVYLKTLREPEYSDGRWQPFPPGCAVHALAWSFSDRLYVGRVDGILRRNRGRIIAVGPWWLMRLALENYQSRLARRRKLNDQWGAFNRTMATLAEAQRSGWKVGGESDK